MPNDPRIVGPGAGATHVHTIRLRGRLPLNANERQRIRRMRKRGQSFAQIAAQFPGVTEDDVQLVIATVRTRRDDPPRVSLNVSVAVANHYRAQARLYEPVWITCNRVVLGIDEGDY
jgi:hypothetical protein